MLAGLSVACAQPESPAIAASAALRTAVIQSAVPVHLPEPLRDYVAGYGPYGSKLLADAQDRVIEAVYQLAVLLLAADSVNGSAEAHRLLIYAAAAEHPAALDLLDANPHLDRLDAAGHACALADAAAATGRGAMAMIFYECAARGGLPAASVKLADALLADGRQAQAVHWLAMAAHQGDLRAEIRLETLHRTGHVPVPPGTAAVIDR
jgi:TPR repeat protein